MDKLDTCEILLDTDGEIRYLRLELTEEMWARVQSSEKGDIGVGRECCREKERLVWDVERCSEFGRSNKNWGEFQKETGRLYTE